MLTINEDFHSRFANFLNLSCLCTNFFNLPIGYIFIDSVLENVQEDWDKHDLLSDRNLVWAITEPSFYEIKRIDDLSNELGVLIWKLIVDTLTLIENPTISKEELESERSLFDKSLELFISELNEDKVKNMQDYFEFIDQLEAHCQIHELYDSSLIKALLDKARTNQNRIVVEYNN